MKKSFYRISIILEQLQDSQLKGELIKRLSQVGKKVPEQSLFNRVPVSTPEQVLAVVPEQKLFNRVAVSTPEQVLANIDQEISEVVIPVQV